MKHYLPGIVLLALALAGCARRFPMGDGIADLGPTAAVVQEPAAQTAPAEDRSVKLAEGDVRFIYGAVSNGLTLVRIGQLATQRGQQPVLRQLGERLVEEHSKANQQLEELAAKNGLQLPTDPNHDQPEAVQELSFLTGAEFDQACARDLVMAHARAIRMYTSAADQAGDPQIRKFAKDKLPILEKDLRDARRLGPGMLPDFRRNALDQE